MNVLRNLPKICKSYSPLKVRTWRVFYSHKTSTGFRFDSDEEDIPYTERIAARLVELSPTNIKPYLKLARFDKPYGIWLTFWPCTWGIASAAAPGCLPDFYLLALFGAGAVVMRSAGCTINDILDRDLDSNVERSLQRPLVNGDISINQAWAFLIGQLGVGLAILLQLNWYSVILGASSLILLYTYPLMKRVTYWPSLVLGLTINWGALLGYSAIKGGIDLVVLPLYFGGVCWSIFYDTIYAHQDKMDDLRFGIKSTALRFGSNTKYWLAGFSTMMISGMTVSGIMCEQTWPFYGALTLAGMHLASQIATLNIDDPIDCRKKFLTNYQVGLLLACGFILGKLYQGHQEKSDDVLPQQLPS